MPDLFGNSRLRDELNAWQKSIDSLSSEDKEALDRAIQNATQYSDFVESAPRGHETEALLLGVLLAQQKRIEKLKRKFGRDEKKD
jgi:hypothetical protein